MEDTTYLGMLFNLSAHSPLRDSHRVANHSSLRRPSSKASAPSASSVSTLAHASRSFPPNWPNQPPSAEALLAVGVLDDPVERDVGSDDNLSHFGSPFPSVLSPSRIQTPQHRETGRPRTAQFAPRPVSIGGWDHDRAREGDATVGTVDLITRARAGDGDAFEELTQPYRRELQVHCYRMLGSFQDAEDVLQDTLLAAWQGLGGFEERASLRTWLYRIATNRCLNARRSASRRQAKEWDVPGVEPPEPTRLGEVPWLQPYPDTLLEGAIDVPPGPEARYEQTESISLAFVTALQLLPPRQLAVLVLRDVLGFHASEVADMLDSTRGVGEQRPQTGPCRPAGEGFRRVATACRRPPPTRHPRTRSWPSSSRRTSPPISTRWWHS